MALDAASGHLAGTENACPSKQQVESSASEVESVASDVDSDDEAPADTLGAIVFHNRSKQMLVHLTIDIRRPRRI